MSILSKEYEMSNAQSARVLDTVLDTIVEVRYGRSVYGIAVGKMFGGQKTEPMVSKDIRYTLRGIDLLLGF